MFNISISNANVNSKLYIINPLAKIIITLFFSVYVFFLKNIYALFACLLVSIVYAFIAEKSLWKILKYVWNLKIFYLFIFVFNYLFYRNLISSVMSVGQLVSIFLLNIALIKTTGKRDMEYGLYKLLWPFRVFGLNVNSIVMIISLIIRFIPEIISSENKILLSQYSRGVNFKDKRIINKMYIIYSSVIPLINLCIKKADAIADTMDVRCYNVNTFSNWQRKVLICDIIYVIINIAVFIPIFFLEVQL